ncbi:dienelactone hydrolase family protein [Fodinicola acaciae]|uniref:dienelactone hydrolase family protein n=1 Tax=Fodinicola acaciae TaxID=2681555 RepID=UPI0013D0054E|nr:dienelactone hydrolase family protein [Fodinicola acaciae]
MCYERDAKPPSAGRPQTGITAEPVVLTSSDGASFAAYLAQPLENPAAGVLVQTDNKGLSGFYEQLCQRLAEQGHPALAIDFFGRTAGVDYPHHGDIWPHLRALTRDGIFADMRAGIAKLREIGCQTVVSLGFCMGGRFAFYTALPEFGVAGVIGLYGFPGELNGKPGPTQEAAGFRVPILGLFGGADDGIGPDVIAAFDQALETEHEFIVYPGAPHGFFELDQAEFADAQQDAWRRILDFLRRRIRPVSA